MFIKTIFYDAMLLNLDILSVFVLSTLYFHIFEKNCNNFSYQRFDQFVFGCNQSWDFLEKFTHVRQKILQYKR